MDHIGVYLKGLTLASLVAVGSITVNTAIAADKGKEAEKSAVEQGKKLAFEIKKGNCLACHMMGDGEAPGNIAPPLIAMKARFPDKDKLRAQIWDATVANPATSMPPFGLHQILSDEEIDQIVEYVYSL